MICLTIEQLRYDYPGGDLFRLNLPVARYDFEQPLGIYGLSGAGKTTLAQLLAGVLNPTAGKINWESNNPKPVPPKILYTPQFPEHLFLAGTLREQVDMIVRYRPGNRQTEILLRQYLNGLGLNYDQIADRSGFQLSGGELRRFAIALPMALQPDVLILDEPTIGMGPSGRRALTGLITDFGREHGVILLSHDFNWLAEGIGRLWIVHAGQLAFEGTMDELNRNLTVQKTAGILSYRWLMEALTGGVKSGEPAQSQTSQASGQ